MNLTDTKWFRIVESKENGLIYSTEYIQNAVKFIWFTDRQDETIRN